MAQGQLKMSSVSLKERLHGNAKRKEEEHEDL